MGIDKDKERSRGEQTTIYRGSLHCLSLSQNETLIALTAFVDCFCLIVLPHCLIVVCLASQIPIPFLPVTYDQCGLCGFSVFLSHSLWGYDYKYESNKPSNAKKFPASRFLKTKQVLQINL